MRINVQSIIAGKGQGKREQLKRLIRYYRENQNRIDYYRYRTLGIPYGSGVVESAHGMYFNPG